MLKLILEIYVVYVGVEIKIKKVQEKVFEFFFKKKRKVFNIIYMIYF